MSDLLELFISARESHIVRLVEVCKPRSKHDSETHRVQIQGGGVVRVCKSQLRPWPIGRQQGKQ
jgi:hypothetical protein